ncbi:MAG: hypothetical protein ABI432_02055, partial [Flavobacteriales bacterium]
MRVHANDGISAHAKASLQEEGFKVTTDHVPQDQLVDYLSKEKVDVLLVRSATKVRKDLIDACPTVKLIGRGGVGLDNIDVGHAKQKGVPVINTPASSSISVAELVIAHLFSLMRNLHKANRRMPAEGRTHFKELKKEYERLSTDGFRVLAIASKVHAQRGIVAGDSTPYTKADECDLVL